MKKFISFFFLLLVISGCGHFRAQIDFENDVRLNECLVKESYCITKLEYVWFNDYYEKSKDEIADELQRLITLAYPTVFKNQGKSITVSIREDLSRGKRYNDDQVPLLILSAWSMGVIPVFGESYVNGTVKITFSNTDEGTTSLQHMQYRKKIESRDSLGVVPVALLLPYFSPDYTSFFDNGWYVFSPGERLRVLWARAIGAAIINQIVEYERKETIRQERNEKMRGPKINLNKLPF